MLMVIVALPLILRVQNLERTDRLAEEKSDRSQVCVTSGVSVKGFAELQCGQVYQAKACMYGGWTYNSPTALFSSGVRAW